MRRQLWRNRDVARWNKRRIGDAVRGRVPGCDRAVQRRPGTAAPLRRLGHDDLLARLGRPHRLRQHRPGSARLSVTTANASSTDPDWNDKSLTMITFLRRKKHNGLTLPFFEYRDPWKKEKYLRNRISEKIVLKDSYWQKTFLERDSGLISSL